MAKIIYRGPSGETETDPDVNALRERVLSFPSEYWREGSGDATLKHESGATMLVLPNPRLGIYLKYSANGFRGGDDLLSLHDVERLDETADCSDEWQASVGLFLPTEVAWRGIEEFLRSGRASSEINWIRPTEIPQGGNC